MFGVLIVVYKRLLAWLDNLAAEIHQRFPGSVPVKARGSAFEKFMNALFVILLMASLLFAFVDRDVIVFLAREDSILQNATAAFYLIAAILNSILLIRIKNYPLLRLNLLVLSLLFFIVGMEEISWGQRLFNIETPEALEQINIQNELTLHNIWSISLTTFPALFVTTTLLVFFPLFNRYSTRARKYLSAIQFPTAAFELAFLYVAMVVVYFIIGFRLGTPLPLPISYKGLPSGVDDEFMEFFISYLFLVASFTYWRIDLRRAQHVKESS
ncbi:MAG TPA: hypothetical protein EYH05_15625 [Anaerolineae bacterium]|nr:hypothetical protein [Anaerolineae bacterium]